MNIKFLLLILFISSRFTENCIDPNCTSCQDDACLSCDNDKMVFLQNGSCVEYSGANCAKIDQEGECIICHSQFVLTTSGDCAFIGQKVFGCEMYQENDGEIKCVACQPQFRMCLSRCFPKLKNCFGYQNGRNRCIVCEKGYVAIDGLCKVSGVSNN